MRNLILSIFCYLFAFSINAFSQNTEIFHPLLDDLDIEQLFPFGTSILNSDYVEYKKNKVKLAKIKNNKFVSAVYYYENNKEDEVFGIGIEFKSKRDGSDFINKIKEQSEGSESFTTLGQYPSTYENIYYKNFIIKYSTPTHIEVYCYDFSSKTNIYDDFEKTGLCINDDRLNINCGESGYANSQFVYFGNTASKSKKILFQFEYTGFNWMMANEVVFLLSKGDTKKIPFTHIREIKNDRYGSPLCHEICTADIEIEYIDKIISQNDIKLKINGEKFSWVIIFNPSITSSLKYAKKCYINNVFFESAIKNELTK